MAVFYYISAIIAPALAWIVYFYYKDRFQPEPLRNLGLTSSFSHIWGSPKIPAF
jgi:RsiW-degrading membrane proteinase PrsW (M82 family)